MPEPWGNGVAREQHRVFLKLKRAIAKRVKRGVYEGMETADQQRLKDYDPLVELAVIANDPETHTPLRIMAHVKVAEYVYGSLKAPEVQAALAAQNITVQIAPFAAGRALPPPSEDSEPRKVEAEVVEDE